jgi:hypothetical protein
MMMMVVVALKARLRFRLLNPEGFPTSSVLPCIAAWRVLSAPPSPLSTQGRCAAQGCPLMLGGFVAAQAGLQSCCAGITGDAVLMLDT